LLAAWGLLGVNHRGFLPHIAGSLKKEDVMISRSKLSVKAVLCAIIVGLSMPALALADWPGQRWQRNRYERNYDRDERHDRWERRRFRQRQSERLRRYYQSNQYNRWNNNYRSQRNPWSSRNWWSRPFRY
jgi:hypothetical protein